MSARWTSLVNGIFQFLVSDCSSRYLIGVCKLFLLKIRIQFDSDASRVYTDNAKMILSIHCEQCNYDIYS